MRSEQLVRLSDERAVRVQLLGFDLEQPSVVGNDVQMDGNGATWIEIEPLEVPAGKHRRIDERFERRRLERRYISRRRRRFKGSRKLPALRQSNGRFDGNLPCEISRRIERHHVPLQV